MGKISKVLEKSGYTFGQQEQKSTAEFDEDSAISSNTENKQSASKVGSDRAGLLKPLERGKGAEKNSDTGRLENDRSLVGAKSNAVTRPKTKSILRGWDERLTKVTQSSSRLAEEFRILRSKILVPQDGRPVPKSIMVTSVLPDEGKSFTTANLGVALAQGVDQHSLLVDCDLRKPSLAQLFGASSDRGLAEYLQGTCGLESLIQKTSLDKLSILASGKPQANPAELLASIRMNELIEELSFRYPDRFVVFDSPPLQVASESIVLSQVVDGVVLVLRQGVTSRSLLKKFIIEIGEKKILGVIFNGYTSNVITSKLVNKNQYYYGNYYGKKAEV